MEKHLGIWNSQVQAKDKVFCTLLTHCLGVIIGSGAANAHSVQDHAVHT